MLTKSPAHDVAEDMVEAELSSVTLVQRSPTAILPYKYFKTLHQPRYNKDSDIEVSDRAEWGLPFPVLGVMSSTIFKNLYSRDPEPFDSLRKVGFEAELPQILKIHERAGGHYLDVGCSQKIIDGKINAKKGDIESFTPTGLKFTDGSTLDADLIIFATGFNTNIREEMEKIVGPEVGNLLEDNNGWDKEAEVRGGWKRHGRKYLIPSELPVYVNANLCDNRPSNLAHIRRLGHVQTVFQIPSIPDQSGS